LEFIKTLLTGQSEIIKATKLSKSMSRGWYHKWDMFDWFIKKENASNSDIKIVVFKDFSKSYYILHDLIRGDSQLCRKKKAKKDNE
jgi:hypothetical protein